MHFIRRIVTVVTFFITFLITHESSGHESKNEITHSFREISSANLQKSQSRSYPILDGSNQQAHSKLQSSSDSCYDELSCSVVAPNDKHGLEAIRLLHRQLDDDENGAVDPYESDDFLREELQYESGAERRQKAFHRNDDMHISVKELWEAWVRSEVHNWTIEQTVEWLSVGIGLPQYAQTFITNNVNGATLPRLAVSNMQYLSSVLGIKDPIHKQKIALKAMDVVLFGPPKELSNHIKDGILVTLLLGAIIGFWYAYKMNKNSRRHLKRMIKDMESLQKAELALENLQKELERARQEQECATTQKADLERKLLEQCGDGTELRTSYSDLEVSQLKAEIELLRSELQRAEGELEDRCWSPPVGLQQWLQLTHEIENKAYIKKKLSAEKQLQSAREACEKLRKKRSSLVGAFVSTHGKSIDEVDRSIVEARTLLNEVTQELAERVHRWKKIELLCGFNIINNRGLNVLEAELYKGVINGRSLGSKDRLGDSAADADSSGSEKMGGDDESTSSHVFTNEPTTLRSIVEFVVGGDQDDASDKEKCQKKMSVSTSPRDRALMPYSASQEFHSEHELTSRSPIGNVKTSLSESSLESPVMPVIQPRHRRPPTISSTAMNRTAQHISQDSLTLPSPVGTGSTFDEEACSTDSNSTAADDGTLSDKSIKKNKLRFPKFSRKSRHTPPPEKHT
ncbi:stromal interaction molecule isoform X2 [Rhodnius prolixus]|uniref:stromal interaction molecule isoform X2 n=1 Tax=Rhodnius prolixus TaxID=13249 RepID=UPI003D187F97